MNTLSLELWTAWFLWLSNDENCYRHYTRGYVSDAAKKHYLAALGLFDAVGGTNINKRFARAVWLAEQMDWIE